MIDLLAPLLISIGLGENGTEASITTSLQLLLGVHDVELFWLSGCCAIKIQLPTQLLKCVVFFDKSSGLLGIGGPNRCRPLPQEPWRLSAEVIHQREHRLEA